MTDLIRSGLGIMMQPGAVAELRILEARLGANYIATMSGYFDDLVQCSAHYVLNTAKC